MAKKILIGIGALIVLLIAAAFIVPMVIDWNGYKADVAAAVEKATGRKLAITGDISVRLLPSPSLTAKGIAFDNVAGGSQPAMASLDEVTVDVALFPLIAGDIKVEKVVLTRPVILLETLPDGRANWEMTPAEGGTSGSGGDSGGGTPAVSLDSLQIVGGTLIYRDGATGEEERVEELNAELSAGSLQGPFTLAGTAKVRGLPSTLDLAVGKLEDGAVPPVKLTFGLPESGASATVDGRIAAGEAFGFQGTVTAKGSNLAAALQQLSGQENLPPLLGQAFELTSNVSVDPSAAKAENLTLALGPSRGSGQVIYTLAPEPAIDAKLNFPQLDLDTLLAQAKAPGETTTAAPAGESAGAAPAAQTLLPPGLTGSIELAVGVLTYNGQPVQDVTFAADIRNDVVTLRDIAMGLPGPSTLKLSGKVALKDGAPAFDGKVALASDKLRTLLSWLGTDLDQVPPDRLGRFAFATDVSASGSQVALTGLTLTLDSTNAAGAANLALGQRLGIGAGLTIDKLNVDAYLPPAESGGSGGTGASGGQTAGGGLEALKAFDANLDLRIDSLTYQGTQVANIRLEGTLAKGVMTFKQAKLGQVAGGSLSYVGSVAVDGPTLDGTLELSASDPAKLARLAGIDPATVAPLGPFGLSANLKGTPAKMGVNARLNALGGDFTAAGTVEPAGGGPLSLAFTAKHPSLANLMEAFGQAGALPAGFGGIDAGGKVTLNGSDIAVADLKGQVGPLAIEQASLNYAGSGQRPVLIADIAAGVIDLAAFAQPGDGGGSKKSGQGSGERWSKDPLGLEGLRDLDATVKIKARSLADGETHIDQAALDLVLQGGLLTLNSLTGTVNGGALAANGQVDARQETPTLAAAFQLKGMDLAPFFAGVFPVGQPAGTANATGQLASAGNSVYALVDKVGGNIDASGVFNLKTGGLGSLGGKGLEIGGQVLEGLLGKDAKGLSKVKNVTDGAALLIEALADHDSPFVAKILLNDGVATLQQVQINGNGLTAKATGTADLIPFTGDIVLAILLNDQPDQPYYQEQRIGLLDDPEQILRTGLLLQGKAPDALPEAEAPSVIEQILPGAEGEGLPNPQQIIEGLTGQGSGEQPAIPGVGDIVKGVTGQESEQPAAEEPAKAEEQPAAEEPAKAEEQPAAEEPAKAEEQPAAEEPAKAEEQPAAEEPAKAEEQPAAEEPAKAEEQPAAEEPAQAEEQPAAEEPAKTAEPAAPAPAPATEETAQQPGTAEQPAEQTNEQPAAEQQTTEQQAEQPAEPAAPSGGGAILPKLIDEVLQ